MTIDNLGGWRMRDADDSSGDVNHFEDDDPTLETEMRDMLRRMAEALIDDPAELQRRYDEIDAALAKLTKPDE